VCKEGQIRGETIRDTINDQNIQAAVQCQGGKWIRIR
jgi:hypothetical protein